MLAPGGKPIGTVWRRSDADIRTLPGGDRGAQQFFSRMTAGRGGTDITPKGHSGVMLRLPDGSIIGYRPISTSGSPAIDVKIPGFALVRKLHFE